MGIIKIIIKTKRLESVFSGEKSLIRKYGNEMAKKIQMRINSLNAAENLGDFWPPYSGPERCHELKEDLKGYFSIDLKHPYRLLISPSETVSKKEFPNEADRWKQINEIVVHKIENTHD